MKLQLILTISILLLSKVISAQVTYAKPEEFKIIKKRPLIVEMLELDNKLIENWKKKKSKTKKPDVAKRYGEMITEYTLFVESYNTNIKSAVEKYWDLNENVEYKTTTEVKNLRSGAKHSVLWFSESSSNAEDGYGFKYFPDLTIPTLNYGRIEKGRVKVDYSFFMPYTGKRDKNEPTLGDLKLSLKLMKNHIAEIEKSGEKKYIFKNYSKNQAKQNCNELKGKNIVISNKTIHKKATFPQIKSAYKSGEIKEYTEDEITKAIENEEDIVVGLCVPWTIAAGSLGPTSIARILYLKAFINIKTGKIYTCFGTVNGEMNDTFFRVKEFTKYGVCK